MRQNILGVFSLCVMNINNNRRLLTTNTANEIEFWTPRLWNKLDVSVQLSSCFKLTHLCLMPSTHKRFLFNCSFTKGSNAEIWHIQLSDNMVITHYCTSHEHHDVSDPRQRDCLLKKNSERQTKRVHVTGPFWGEYRWILITNGQ